jgi:hypothetical protein
VWYESRCSAQSGNLTIRDVKVSEMVGHRRPCVATRTSIVTTNNQKRLKLRLTYLSSIPDCLSPLPIVNKRIANMPQYHSATGTVSYPDAKSSFPKFPQVGFGRAVAIGIGAGFVGALVYVNSGLTCTLQLTD